MVIEYAREKDFQFILNNDKHVSKNLIENKISNGEIFVVREGERNVGWLRYGYFWDNIPFMNMLYLDCEYRGIGIGKALVGFWESEMKSKGYSLVMTSTQSDEQAQHFYRKLKYKDAGSLLLENEPLEIILTKRI